jgi:hypothetical protein
MHLQVRTVMAATIAAAALTSSPAVAANTPETHVETSGSRHA